MEDRAIVELYFQRNEDAIAETDRKYGRYCKYISYNILYSTYAAEECANEAYFNAWNSIPPTRPKSLKAYMARLVRNVSINRYVRERAAKRSSFIEEVFDELSEIIPDGEGGEICEAIAFREALNEFLSTLSKSERVLFVRRYFYTCSVKELSEDFFTSESGVKVSLMRLRERLKAFLSERDIEV